MRRAVASVVVVVALLGAVVVMSQGDRRTESPPDDAVEGAKPPEARVTQTGGGADPSGEPGVQPPPGDEPREPEVDPLEAMSPEERERYEEEERQRYVEERDALRRDRDLERLRDTIDRLAAAEDLDDQTVQDLDDISSDYLLEMLDLQDATRGDADAFHEGMVPIRAQHRGEVEDLLGGELADVYLEMHRSPLRDIGR